MIRLFIGVAVFFFVTRSFAQTAEEIDVLYENANQQVQQGNYGAAAELFEKCAIIEKKLSEVDSATLALELQNAGLCYHLSNKNSKAIPILQESYDIFEKTKSVNEQIAVLYLLIEVYQSLNITEKQLEIQSLNKLIELSKGTNNVKETVLSYNKISSIYSDMSQSDIAYLYTQQALPYLEKLDFKRLVAFAYNNHGNNCIAVGEMDSALFFLNKAYSIYKELNIPFDIAVVSSNMAAIYQSVNNFELSDKFYNESFTQFTTATDKKGIANSLNGLAKNSELIGKYEDAKSKYDQALKLYEEIKDYANQAVVFINIGNLMFAQSDYPNAFQYLNHSMKIYEDLKDSYGKSVVFNNLGSIYQNLGEYDEALKNYNKSYKVFVSESDKASMAGSLNNIGSVYNAYGQYDSALVFYNQALTIQKSLNRERETANSLNNIADLYSTWGMFEKSLEFYSQSLLIFQKIKSLRGQAITMSNIGSVYFSLGNYDKAIEYYTSTFGIYEKIKDKSLLSSVTNNLGTVYYAKKDYNNAAAQYVKALEMRQQIGEKAGIASSAYNLGVSQLELKNYDKAVEYLETSINILEELRKTAREEFKTSFLASQIQVYESMILCNILKNDISKALYYHELSSSKSLAEKIKKDNPYQISTLNDFTGKISDDVISVIYSTSDNPSLSLFVVGKQGTPISRIISKNSFIDVFLFDVNTRTKIIAKLSKSEFSEIKQYIQNKEKYQLRVELKKKIFDIIVAVYIESLSRTGKQDKDLSLKIGKELYNLLIKPIESSIIGKKKLLIIPGGIIGRIPFETLVNDKNEYLISAYDIFYNYSMSVFCAIKDRNYSQTRKPVLAMGISQYSGNTTKTDEWEINKDKLNSTIKLINKTVSDNQSLKSIYNDLGYEKLNDLPFSTEEIASIKNLFNESDTFLNSKVSESRLKHMSQAGQLSGYRILHFATHGISIPEISRLGCLVLFQFPIEVNNEDGFLRIEEIARLSLNTDMVNLSACQTGAGKVVSGEGVQSLGQPFIISGSKSVLTSQWEVDDKATAKFMTDFYTELKASNYDYVKSINTVKRGFIEGKAGVMWKDPLFWAAFTFYGF